MKLLNSPNVVLGPSVVYSYKRENFKGLGLGHISIELSQMLLRDMAKKHFSTPWLWRCEQLIIYGCENCEE